MEVTIHFIFTLVKISIQASAYAALMLIGFRLIARKFPDGWFDRVSLRAGRFWLVCGFATSLALFIFLFSYWGSHGFGDGPRVPIGHGSFVDNTNWTEYGYIEGIKTSDGHGLEMTQFLVSDGRLMGNLDSWFDTYDNKFFVYDMRNRMLVEFPTEMDFNSYTKSHGLPSSTGLRSFSENYHERWGGWWFWLLP